MSASVHTPEGGARPQEETPGQGCVAGGPCLKPVDVPEVDVVAVARGAVELLRATRRLHGVEVTLELPDAPSMCPVGARRVRQVMLLLLAHAAQAANGRGVRLTVEPPDDFGDVGPRFQVVAPGASLSERELRSALLSAAWVGPPHRRLARARGRVESLGGTLAVAGGQGSGLTVTVELPAPGLASW